MNHFQPHNILVTGGAGFIGANFIRHLLGHHPDAQITNLDLLTYAGSLDNLENLDHVDRYQFVHGNICDKALLKDLLERNRIDTIIHFAAESHVDRSINAPGTFVQTNIVGTFTLLETARHYWLENKQWTHQQCRFHHISTDEVYGSLQANDPAFTEQHAYAPNSPYSASKAGSDHLVRAYYHTYALPVTTTNCSNNYGPYQHPEKFIPTIIHSCLQQKQIPIYGNGANVRDWLYVDDHCRGIMAVLQHGRLGETYNIGGNNEWNNLALAKLICELMDELYPTKNSHEKLIKFVTDRPGHDWRYAINSQKIQTELQWHSQQNFREGLKKTIAFYAQKSTLA